MNIIERWKMATHNEGCVSKKGYIFVKIDGRTFISTLAQFNISDEAILDDWTPKRKKSLTVWVYLCECAGTFFVHHMDYDKAGEPIKALPTFPISTQLVTFEWEE